ncbi:hypothetical protein ACM67F_08100 [Neisseria polysaccharea]
MPSEGFRRHRGSKRRQPETDKPPFPGITALSEKMEKPGRKTLPPTPTPQPKKHPDSTVRRLPRKPQVRQQKKRFVVV